MLSYRKTFDPEALQRSAPKLEKQRRPFVADYEYDEPIVLAVNVALATGRPLLLRGDAGSGKSTLAEDVARLLRYRYYEKVVSSNAEVGDLLWRIDHLSRIADAHAGDKGALAEPLRYLRPGVLFWAFEPERAKIYGDHEPKLHTWEIESPGTTPAVVLLDEIDKAEPDFPNDILAPLGSLSFQVHAPNINLVVEAKDRMRPLVFVTTNEERDLPDAFLRRCVVLRLDAPGPDRLSAIARRHFSEAQLNATTLETLKTRYYELRVSAEKQKLRPPGTAEFLDAARAISELRKTSVGALDDFVDKNAWAFRQITQATLWKHRRAAPEPNS